MMFHCVGAHWHPINPLPPRLSYGYSYKASCARLG